MIETQVVVQGDTRTPFGFKLVQGKRRTPVNLTGKTVKVFGFTDAGGEWIDETSTGVAVHPTSSFTADDDTSKLLCDAHKVEAGDQILLASAGTLPAPLSTSRTYFARDIEPNAFRLALEPGGAAVSLTSTGTGSHTFYVRGSGRYQWTSDDVAAAGKFWLWVRVYESALVFDTFPAVRDPRDRGLPIEIVAAS